MIAVIYKEFYNKDRGLPEPVWGSPCGTHGGVQLQCPTCSSKEIYFSGSIDDPEETLGETVRCKRCGYITDRYEAYKQGLYHSTRELAEVIQAETGGHKEGRTVLRVGVMKTLSELVKEVSEGLKRADGKVMVDKPYDAKCYRVGEIIRVDLKPEEPAYSEQGFVSR